MYMNNLDEKFQIETGNRGASKKRADGDHHYEATPYPFINALFNEYELDEGTHFVDFGSGKGRLLFYVHHRFHCRVKGVEKDEQLHKIALKNRKAYVEQSGTLENEILLFNQGAENYQVHDEDNVFYFFNPFSLLIFNEVVQNILTSWQNNRRQIQLIFYYPREKYLNALKKTSFTLEREVLIPGISRMNKEERFLIYTLDG